MTDPEIQIALALGQCIFSPASWDKRFCHDIAAVAELDAGRNLSERQRDNLLRMAHKYRRQLPVHVVEAAQREIDVTADASV